MNKMSIAKTALLLSSVFASINTAFANNINISNGTSFNTSTFYSSFINDLSTGIAPIIAYDWPQVRSKIQSGSIPLGSPAPIMTTELVDNYDDDPISCPPVASRQASCYEINDDICDTLILE